MSFPSRASGTQAVLASAVLSASTVIGPSSAAAQVLPQFPTGGAANNYEVALCAAAGPVACSLAYTSATAAREGAGDRFPNARFDGQRGNAFQHSSWNARMAVLIGRSLAEGFSTAHEQPLTSGNPAGTNQTNRHERMDLCNNRRGWNRPSNWEIVTLNQSSAVGKLATEAANMQEDGARPEVLESNESCNGSILVFLRKTMELGSDEWLRALIDAQANGLRAPSLDDLDPVSRFVVLARLLSRQPMSVHAQLEHLPVAFDVSEPEGQPDGVPSVPDGPGPLALESARIALRAALPADADLIYGVVNDPEISWRLPTRGAYVSPDQVISSIANGSSHLTIAYERHTGKPVTVLALTGSSERNGVAEFSFYSLRNSSDPYGSQSIEALVCYFSVCFNLLGFRKLVASIPEPGYGLFKAAEGFVFEVEGVRRSQVKVGARYVDLVMIAIWADNWSKFERILRPILKNWQV